MAMTLNQGSGTIGRQYICVARDGGSCVQPTNEGSFEAEHLEDLCSRNRSMLLIPGDPGFSGVLEDKASILKLKRKSIRVVFPNFSHELHIPASGSLGGSAPRAKAMQSSLGGVEAWLLRVSESNHHGWEEEKLIGFEWRSGSEQYRDANSQGAVC